MATIDLNKLGPQLADKVQKARQAGLTDDQIMQYSTQDFVKNGKTDKTALENYIMLNQSAGTGDIPSPQGNMGGPPVDQTQQPQVQANTQSPGPAKVIDSSTGKQVDLSGSGPLFDGTNSQQQQPKSNSLLDTILNGGKALVKGAGSFLIPQTIKQYSNAFGAIKNAQQIASDKTMTPQQKATALAQLQQNAVSSDNSSKSKTALELGSYAIPFGEGGNLLSKAILPGAAVGATRALSTDNPTLKSVAGGAAIGSLLGLGGDIVSKGLGKVGEGLAGAGLNLTKTMENKLAGLNGGETVAQTITKNGLQGADVNALDKGIQQQQKVYDSIANSNTPINTDIFLKNADAALQTLKNSPVTSVQQIATKLEQNINNIMDKISSGKIVSNADLNAAKQAFDKATSDSQFGTGDWGANRFAGDVLRKTLNESSTGAGPNGENLKDIGLNLRNLRNIQDLAQNREGMGAGGSIMSLSNLFLSGVGAAAGGIPGAVAAVGARKVLDNPMLASILSKGATSLSGAPMNSAIQGGANAAVNNGLGLLNKTLFPNSQGSVDQGNNNAQQEPVNYSHTVSSVPQIDNKSPLIASTKIPQGLAPSPNSNLVTNDNQAIIKDSKTGNYTLPPISQLSNKIPGMNYTPEQYQADKEKINNVILQNSNNPAFLSVQLPAVEAYSRSIDQKFATNKAVADQYVSTHQLDPTEVQFMRGADTQNKNMNILRDLIPKIGIGIWNDNPQVAALRSKTDPNYAVAAALMNTLRGQAVRAVEGGRPSNFDIQLFNNMPAPGDTKDVALAKLEHVQETLINQYAAWSPMYGYTIGGNQTQQPQDQTQSAPQVLQNMGVLPPQAQPTRPIQNNNTIGNDFLNNTLYGRTPSTQ